MGLFLPSQSKYFNMSVSDDEFVLDLTKMKMADLKKELQLRDLKVSGNKQELIQRLQQYLEEHEGAEIEDGGEDEALLAEGNDQMKEKDEKMDEESTENLEKELEDEELEKTEEVTEKVEEAVEEIKAANDTQEHKKEAVVKAVTVEEAKAERAKKFGIKVADKVVPEEKKKEERTKRFGKSSITDHKVEVDTEKLKQRAARFGTVISSTLTKTKQNDKILKRKERFGAVSAETNSKKAKRAERFGLNKAA